MKKLFIVSFAALLVLSGVFGKGGGRSSFGGSRGSSSSRGFSWGRSKSSSSSGGSWFSWGRSKPAASPSFSSPSYKSPSPPSYGWNTGGAPPAYPGLQNRPVHHSYSPPAYSPSFSNPPSYSSGYRKSYKAPNYGSQFGSSGVGRNTYIHNNYYGGGVHGGSSSSSKFLTHSLFHNYGRHRIYTMSYGSGSRSWSERQDREWRETTQAPYFENKVPGGESILPAAAVIGAATAFGLTTLLPLNVPVGKPLMYCNSSFIEQNPIRIDDNTYSCANGSISISCLRTDINGTNSDECLSSNKTLQCDLLESYDKVFCTNGTLLSRSSIYCKTTTQFNTSVVVNGTSVNATETILNCNFGELPKNEASFIPTTSTEAPSTSDKSLSLVSQMHVFFLTLIGESHILDTTTPVPTTTTEASLNPWIPEAMTIPSTTTDQTTTEKYYVAYKFNVLHSNGTYGYKYVRVSESYNQMNGSTHDGMVYQVPRSYFDTTEAPITSSTDAAEESAENDFEQTEVTSETSIKS